MPIEIKVVFLQIEIKATKKMNTLVEPLDDTDVMEMQDELSPEQRMRWDASIERDMRDIAGEKTQKYITLEQFGEELRAAIRRRI